MDNKTYEGWLNYYKKVHALKRPNRSPNSSSYEDFIKRTHDIVDRSSAYLNACGVPVPAPLWKYDPDDPTTHVSSRSFAYYHLVK